jgi:hypothetical protein
MISNLYDTLDNEYAFICFSVLELLAYVLALNHVIACLWYGIGRLGQSEGMRNWLQDAGREPVWGKGLAWKYVTSLHWSLTQLTPAAMDVSACNTMERIFSIVILLFALGVFSSVIGSVTASVTALRNLKGTHLKDFWLLRRYCRENNVTPDLCKRLTKFLEHKIAAKGVAETRVTVLSNLSVQLRQELEYEKQNFEVDLHPFFHYIREEMQHAALLICSKTMTMLAYAEQDVVFEAEEEATMMYFLKAGNFDYQINDMVLMPPLMDRAWVSEAAIWTNWHHVGVFSVREGGHTGELVGILPDAFVKAMIVHPRVWAFAKAYGSKFLMLLEAEARKGALTDILHYEWQNELATLDVERIHSEEDENSYPVKIVNL